MPAPKNNQYAAKDDPATSFLHIRATPREKARWVRQAHAKHPSRKLAPWVTDTLNNACPPDTADDQ
jgi:hypothetical protein